MVRTQHFHYYCPGSIPGMEIEILNQATACHGQKTNKQTKNLKIGVPVQAQRDKNLTSIHEDAGSIPGLAQWVKDPMLL